ERYRRSNYMGFVSRKSCTVACRQMKGQRAALFRSRGLDINEKTTAERLKRAKEGEIFKEKKGFLAPRSIEKAYPLALLFIRMRRIKLKKKKKKKKMKKKRKVRTQSIWEIEWNVRTLRDISVESSFREQYLEAIAIFIPPWVMWNTGVFFLKRFEAFVMPRETLAANTVVEFNRGRIDSEHLEKRFVIQRKFGRSRRESRRLSNKNFDGTFWRAGNSSDSFLTGPSLYLYFSSGRQRRKRNKRVEKIIRQEEELCEEKKRRTKSKRKREKKSEIGREKNIRSNVVVSFTRQFSDIVRWKTIGRRRCCLLVFEHAERNDRTVSLKTLLESRRVTAGVLFIGRKPLWIIPGYGLGQQFLVDTQANDY
ncbi:LOW QUALITY PROTEIN: hypothetical protein V1478_017112, partial [Vespula squamosa]